MSKLEIIGGTDKYVEASVDFIQRSCRQRGVTKDRVLFCWKQTRRARIQNPADLTAAELREKGITAESLFCHPIDGCGAYVDIRNKPALAEEVQRETQPITEP